MGKGPRDIKARADAFRERIRNSPERRPLSRVLLQFIRDSVPPTPITSLRDALGDRGVAAMLFLFAAFNTLPLPLGTSLVSGIPCVMLSWQMMMRRKSVWLPHFLITRDLSESNFASFRARVIPRLFWLEKFIKPRYWPFHPGQDEMILGVLCLILAIALVIPLPLGNWLPAFSIVILALALMQRDGILLLIGLIVSIISLTIFAFVAYGAVFFAENVLQTGHLGLPL